MPQRAYWIYNPDPTNLMSYGHSDCRTYLSPQQIERIRVALYAFRPELLDNTCAGECELSHLLINENHLAGTIWEYEAEESIISSSRVVFETAGYPAANVTYDAGRYICLTPGFNAQYTSNFLAIIDGCGGAYKTYQVDDKNNLAKLPFVIQPNPFSKQCTIVFNLSKDKEITLSVSDITGKKVVTLLNNELRVAGKHQVHFDGSHLPASTYYCTVQAGDKIETKKMILMK